MGGSLAIQEIKDLPISLGQVSRLSTTDHLVRVLAVDADKSIMVMTNVGKTVHLTKDRLQTADAVPSRGSALYSSRRKEEGVRVADAVCVSDNDGFSALDRSGNLTIGSIDQLSGSGTLETKSEILAFCRLPGAENKEKAA